MRQKLANFNKDFEEPYVEPYNSFTAQLVEKEESKVLNFFMIGTYNNEEIQKAKVELDKLEEERE